ncbi:MAG: hypothetical protein Q8S00_23370 [Deltaproteobacteria bacterium]|nr:hypothetical protein [Deltaproteobacteria bacterium]
MFGKTADEIFDECEDIGESAVRIKLHSLSEAYTMDERAAAEEWLRLREQERSAAASKRRDAREERTLLIARHATINSIIATILSAVAIIISASDKVMSFLQWLGVFKP